MDDLIAALERGAEAIDDNMMHWPRTSWPGSQCERDADLIRAYIADLRAGGERAKVVAWLQAGGRYGPRAAPATMTMLDAHAQAIASGAHMENNNAD
jgi:hypothetical protein